MITQAAQNNSTEPCYTDMERVTLDDTINCWIYHFTHPPARTGRASDLWKLYISLQKNYQRSPMSVHTDTIKQILPSTCTLSTPADDRRALHSTLEPSLYE